jgi:hypothetical protein
MAFASLKFSDNLAGYFVERDYGMPFEYAMNTETVLLPDLSTGKNVVYPHIVFVGPRGDQMRMALVKKTVAYVVIDERDGKFQIEKWRINAGRVYQNQIKGNENV